MRKIKREKVWIDPEIVSGKYKHGDNHVGYYLWHDKGKFDASDPDTLLKEVKAKNIRQHTSVCFGSMLRQIHESAWAMTNNSGGWGKKADYTKPSKAPFNRILYNMTEDPNGRPKLTAQERRDWIELSIKNKMLPKYMPLKDLKYYESKNIPMVLSIGQESVVALIYIYLSQLRYFREYPGYVRSVLHLHQHHGMDFIAAFVAGSLVSVDYTVHHYLSLARRYGQSSDINDTNIGIPIGIISGLKRFLRSPGKHDTRKFYKTNSSYKGADTVENISKIVKKVTAQQLFDPLIVRAFSALTDKTSEKYIDQFDTMKKQIQYVEAKK